MYRIVPPAVFAHESVMRHGAYRAGVERVVAALATPRSIETYTDDQLPMLIRERGLLERRVPMGTLPEVRDPIFHRQFSPFHPSSSPSQEQYTFRPSDLFQLRGRGK